MRDSAYTKVITKLSVLYLRRNWQFSRGFTLIELMITIAIFSILATSVIVLINPSEQLAKANDAKRKNDLLQIQKALEVYYQDNQQYPPSSASYEIENTGWGESWQPYMGTLPKDSHDRRTYAYFVDDGGQSYRLYASLERENDTEAQKVCPNGICQNPPPEGACGATVMCNYGVSSPNTSP